MRAGAFNENNLWGWFYLPKTSLRDFVLPALISSFASRILLSNPGDERSSSVSSRFS